MTSQISFSCCCNLQSLSKKHCHLSGLLSPQFSHLWRSNSGGIIASYYPNLWLTELPGTKANIHNFNYFNICSKHACIGAVLCLWHLQKGFQCCWCAPVACRGFDNPSTCMTKSTAGVQLQVLTGLLLHQIFWLEHAENLSNCSWCRRNILDGFSDVSYTCIDLYVFKWFWEVLKEYIQWNYIVVGRLQRKT